MVLANGRTLKWGTKAMFLYCEAQGVDLAGLLDQLAALQFNIKTLVAMVMAASGNDWDEDSIFEWIDEQGGVFAKNGELVDFVNEVVKNTVVNQSEPIAVEVDEKKSASL